MREFMFHLKSAEGDTLQTQLRQQLLGAILDGQLAPGQPLPSSRRLAKQLGVARNTVTLTYQALVEQGFLVSRERSGFYVAEDLSETEIRLPSQSIPEDGSVDWEARFVRHPSEQRNIAKPRNWQQAKYPFIYGQVDPKLFPLAAWRECSRRALGKLAVAEWSPDLFVSDDPLLIEQIRTRVLPRRGVLAADDQILVTMGAQNALWLLASLLMSQDTTVGLENPGYVDARNIFALRAGRVKPLAIDQQGLVPGDNLRECDYVYVTPSHQAPTTVTMPYERRLDLLSQAENDDFIIIEDDYEGETNYIQEATPALKSIDRSGRVLYIGSLSKSIAPGLRMGFLVGPRNLINEARQLRRLVMRHPPSNNQRCVALFIADGHFDSLVHRLRKVYRERWEVMGAALKNHLPHSSRIPTFGGTSFWVSGPKSLDANTLAQTAWDRGLILEPGDIHFLSPDPPKNFFRLGFSSIETELIEPGVELLADLIRRA